MRIVENFSINDIFSYNLVVEIIYNICIIYYECVKKEI